MVSVPLWQLAFPGNAARAPAGCEAGTSPLKSGTATKTAPDTAASPGRTGRNAGADVQAPEDFNLPAQGLWDGRPSPAGVWIASADARDPERVIIRNDTTGETVIGALFRQERENPGPPIRISPDAAKAPGLLAGQPAMVTITALRRAADKPAAAAPATAAAATGTATTAAGPAKAGKSAKTTPQAEPAAVETGALGTGAVPAAIDKADAGTPVMDLDAMAQAAPAAGTAAAPAASSHAAGGKSHSKLGIFSVEANARRAADPVTRAGASAALRKEASKGKLCWSVPAGPAASAANRDALLQKIKRRGSANACFVSR
jgi:hypothetical protein